MQSYFGSRRNGWILVLVCMGVTIFLVDGGSVLMALPRIKAELGFSEIGLGWMLNAPAVTYAAFRLLGGRLGDVFGHRELFLKGLLLFTAGSLAEALAHTQAQMVASRAIQGIAGAMIVTPALSLIVEVFKDSNERVRAFALYSFASAGGGALGFLSGGVITSVLGWRWIFLIDLSIGIIIYACCSALLPKSASRRSSHPLDLAGAVTSTLSLLIATYAILDTGDDGWLAPKPVGLATAAALLAVIFIRIESRTSTPLVPLTVFRASNLLSCCVTNMLYAAASTAGIFASFYMQLVLHHDPFQTALAFLPFNVAMALFSLGPSAKLVSIMGIQRPLIIGLLIMAVGLVLLGQTPVEGTTSAAVLPGLSLLGMGSGAALSPLLAGAMNEVPEAEAGLASGVVGTSTSIGRVLGFAIFITAATARTHRLTSSGVEPLTALNEGYHLAFLLGAAAAICAAALSFTSLRSEGAP